MRHDSTWQRPPRHLTSPPDEVHVWRAALELPASRLEKLARTLAPDEVHRAERFVFERDRDHFIAARGILRAILARYTGEAPERLQFVYGQRGKPALAPPAAAAPDTLADLCFNLSHSQGLALYAVAWQREVGVDVEYIRTNIECLDIARRFFAPQEYAALERLPATAQLDAFFAGWTRKEAYIKARGEGLAHALDAFAVGLEPGGPVALTATSAAASPAEVARWSLYGLPPGPGYAAALAVAGHDWHLRCWQWPPP